MTTRIDLASALRKGGPALMAEAIASLRSVVLELNDNSQCRMEMRTDEKWLQDLQARVAAIPPGNAPPVDTRTDWERKQAGEPWNMYPPKPTALEEPRQVPGATGANAVCTDCGLPVRSGGIGGMENSCWRDRSMEGDKLCALRTVAKLREKLFATEHERATLTARVAELESELAAVRRTLSAETSREQAAHEVTKRASQEWEDAATKFERALCAVTVERDSMRTVVEAAQRLVDADSIDQPALLRELDLKLSALSQPVPAKRDDLGNPVEDFSGWGCPRKTVEPAPVAEGEPRYGYAFPGRLPPSKPVAEGEREIVEGDSVLCDFSNGQVVIGKVLRVDSSQIPYLVEYTKMMPVKHQTWMDARSIRLAPSGNPSTPAAEPEKEPARYEIVKLVVACWRKHAAAKGTAGEPVTEQALFDALAALDQCRHVCTCQWECGDSPCSVHDCVHGLAMADCDKCNPSTPAAETGEEAT